MSRRTTSKNAKSSIKSVKKNVSQLSLASQASDVIQLRQKTKSKLVTSFHAEIDTCLVNRKRMQYYEEVNGEHVDATPKIIEMPKFTDKFHRLRHRIDMQFTELSEVQSGTSTVRGSIASKRSHVAMFGTTKLSMDGLIAGIASPHTVSWADLRDIPSLSMLDFEPEKDQYELPFIKINLTPSTIFVLYEQQSCTVLKGTHLSAAVEEDNRMYEYLTVGKGKIRRRSDIDAQTKDILVKSRSVNTLPIETATVGTYVSYFEMYDTYSAIVNSKLSTGQPLEFITLPSIKPSRRITYNEQYQLIIRMPSFRLASMIIKRLLSSNVYGKRQMRFRNMNPITRLATELNFRYTCRLLFRFQFGLKGYDRKAVSDISFCPHNGDIVAVSYGVFALSTSKIPEIGAVCIWSIKNPGDAERVFRFTTPVVCVEFSQFEPSLIAIGLHDGSIQVYDITNIDEPPIACTKRGSLMGYDPVIAIKWISQVDKHDENQIEPFLSLGQDSTVYQFRIINNPYMAGFKQMVLERVEGIPEGLYVQTTESTAQQSNRHPQGLQLIRHPELRDIYYVLTDEGCIYKCSTNYPNQYVALLKTHDGAVNYMDFSPWSPKLFLTCGNDWCIRIWVDGVFKPLITLTNRLAPVHCAFWSRTNSTIIVAVVRKSIDIWDLNKNILQPMSSTKLDSSHHTVAKFARCGRSIAIGNERGNILMCALDDMPFPPHFQYDELEKAIYSAIQNFPDLTFEVKSIGYFGYPNKSSIHTY